MNALLDTHVVLWYLQGNSTLSVTARTIIDHKEGELYFSIASLWEIAIKQGLGKLEIQRPFRDLKPALAQLDIQILPITFADTETYLSLPLHHRDPFDRILVAQAIARNLILVSRDALLDAYPIQRQWQ
jgi:PIN domain nuclease of toxin-antitoxin system